MKELYYTRIYSDENGDSRFEDVRVDLKSSGMIGYLSGNFSIGTVQFRLNDAGYDWDYHNAPEKQFIVLLDGEIEITTSPGESRIFRGGDVILVEDTEGKGHKTKNIKKQMRRSLLLKFK